MSNIPVWLFNYSNGHTIREITDEEYDTYLAMIQNDTTHTGAVPGDAFGVPGVTVYASF